MCFKPWSPPLTDRLPAAERCWGRERARWCAGHRCRLCCPATSHRKNASHCYRHVSRTKDAIWCPRGYYSPFYICVLHRERMAVTYDSLFNWKANRLAIITNDYPLSYLTQKLKTMFHHETFNENHNFQACKQKDGAILTFLEILQIWTLNARVMFVTRLYVGEWAVGASEFSGHLTSCQECFEGSLSAASVFSFTRSSIFTTIQSQHTEKMQTLYSSSAQ